MLMYRIKQFYWAVESIFINEDIEILNRYLNSAELDLFMKITKAERQHSIRVCKAAIDYINDNNIIDINKDIMCKCALLHDIGKYKATLNIVYKSIIVIINSITNGKLLKYNKSRKITMYYNHPEIGVELLKSIGQNDIDIIDSVKNHHNKSNVYQNKYLEILHICDNSN